MSNDVLRTRVYTTNQYVHSKRVILKSGDKFKANGGPYYMTKDGTKVSMAAKGPFTFISYNSQFVLNMQTCLADENRWLEALDKHGQRVVLPLSEYKQPDLIDVVQLQPYIIKGKTRTKTKCSKPNVAVQTINKGITKRKRVKR